MKHWFRRRETAADAWLYCEIGADGALERHVEFRGPLEQPVAAFSSTEWWAARQEGRLEAYEATFGILTDALAAPADADGTQPLTARAFEDVWRVARSICEARSRVKALTRHRTGHLDVRAGCGTWPYRVMSSWPVSMP
ncbi:hypothetical protein ABT215_27050 [Streptomyces sp900105755]|uniref:hypothetical protein n=1 Tax=Streptomyces sp. 900105755 TaxID=3154389 RepID=UPI003325541E